MKTIINSRLIALSLTAVLSIVLAGCNSASDSSAFGDTAGLSITINPDPGVLNASSTISTQAGLSQYHWTVTYESGSVDPNCLGTSATFACTFQEAGNATISFTAIDSDNAQVGGRRSLRIIDSGALGNQAPLIVASIRNSANSIVAVYATDLRRESGSMSVDQGTYQLDLRSSTDDRTAADQIRFEVQIDGGGYNTVNRQSNLVFPAGGTYAIDIRARDGDGAARIKSFNAYIWNCNPTNPSSPSYAAPLNVNSGNISVTADGIRNFFHYAASGVSGGHGGAAPNEYQYSWDYNGDGIFDSAFSEDASKIDYSIYDSSRAIGLRVLDPFCNYIAATTQTVDLSTLGSNSLFNVASIPVDYDANHTGLAGLVNSYYFVQSDIRPLSGYSAIYDKLENLDLLATDFQGNPRVPAGSPSGQPYRVNCTYRKHSVENGQNIGSTTAYLQVEGSNIYSQRQSTAYYHGIWMNIDGITDTLGAVGQSPVIDTSAAVITDASYFTDGGQDAQSTQEYRKNAACHLNLQIDQYPTVAPCAGAGTSHYAVRITGRYSCPDLRAANTRRVSAGINSGAFYCEESNIDACIGAPGGSGGGTPPPHR